MPGTDFTYVEVESRFGLTTAYSLGRWVLTNLCGIIVLTALVLVFFNLWRETGHPFAIALGAMFAIPLAIGIAFFIWSMTPARKPS